VGTHDLWWRHEPRERYWLESTDRADLGADLRSVCRDARGLENWRHTLFRHAARGDLVFHYDKRRQAIVRVSRITGAAEPIELPWRTHGPSTRADAATVQPGYRIALSEGLDLAEPVTLAQLRASRDQLAQVFTDLRARRRGALYFPFELSRRRPLRLLQGYAFKLPADVLPIFPQLGGALAPAQPSSNHDADHHLELEWGTGLRAKARRWSSQRRPARDLEIWLSHNVLQERLRDMLVAQHGAENVRLEVPLGLARIDLVVRLGNAYRYYEVKTEPTARSCLREALGQLLDYALATGSRPPVGLYVAGPAALTIADEDFLARLQQLLTVPLDYIHVPLADQEGAVAPTAHPPI
jgi:hypothetical protein